MQWPTKCIIRKVETEEVADHASTTRTEKSKALKSREIAWVEGLRGIAALGVLSNHLTLCYANYLFRPCCAPTAGELSPENENQVPHLFQLPIFRLVAAGETFVAMFLVLTGFTAGYKPLAYARSDQVDKAYSSVAISSFRRLPRLFFPATVATVLSWLICNLGGYETSRNGDAWWMIALTPTRSAGPWYQVFVDLWWAIWRPWMPYGVSPYDQPQWALQFFVEAGLMVFLAVLGTARLSTGWRITVLSAWAYWSAHLSTVIRDPWVGYCTLFGMVLAEINFIVVSRKLQTKLFTNIVGSLVIFLGLFAMSYPRDLPERASWSYALRELGETVLPFNNSKYKPWVSLGCLVFIFGVILSSFTQKALSAAPMIWLGKVSFPLYLLHGTFIRSWFAWILFAGQELAPSARDGNILKYPLPSKTWIAFSVLCLMLPLLISCHLWIKYLEPVFDSITMWMERVMLKHAETQELSQWKGGWLSRMRQTLRAVLLVIRHGGIPTQRCLGPSSDDLESESGFLLQETMAEPYSPTHFYTSDDNLKEIPLYRDLGQSKEASTSPGKS